MLIKYYTKNGVLHILENVKNVSVGSNIHKKDIPEMSLESFESADTNVPYIFFESDFGETMIPVYYMAYICNNDGKTIEKVSALH